MADKTKEKQQAKAEPGPQQPRFLKAPFSWWWGGWANSAKRSFDSTDSQEVRKIIASSCKRISQFRKRNRTTRKHLESMRESFALVLQDWEIYEHELPAVKKNLLLEIIGFAILGLFYSGVLIWTLQINPPNMLNYYLAGVVVLPLCSLRVIARSWRLSCLKNRQFVPFREWLGF